MADKGIPHFHNEPGVAVIHTGAREFMCVGAKPPFDHPHIFIDMGDADEIVCPYCSTLFRYDASVPSSSCRPEACLLDEPAAA